MHINRVLIQNLIPSGYEIVVALKFEKDLKYVQEHVLRGRKGGGGTNNSDSKGFWIKNPCQTLNSEKNSDKNSL